jgi:hypothetical protein
VQRRLERQDQPAKPAPLPFTNGQLAVTGASRVMAADATIMVIGAFLAAKDVTVPLYAFLQIDDADAITASGLNHGYFNCCCAHCPLFFLGDR